MNTFITIFLAVYSVLATLGFIWAIGEWKICSDCFWKADEGWKQSLEKYDALTKRISQRYEP